MARIPDQYSLSQQPGLRSGRQIAPGADVSGLVRGVQNLAQGIGDLGSAQVAIDKDKLAQDNVIGVSRAEADWLKGRLDIQNRAEADPNFNEFDKTYAPQINAARDAAASKIADPKMRARWLANAERDAVTANDWLTDQKTKKADDARLAGFDESTLTNYNIIIDPNTPEDARAKARADLEGSIAMAEKSGLLSPTQAFEKRWKLIHGSYDEQGRLDAEAGKLNIPNVDALTNAMIGVESQGDPTAESPKGASGLMQVMPETAAGIAKELGDKNFPSDLEAQKTYLKDKSVSLIYGKKYISDMLTKYGGDEEAALIAYNGGPARADAWLKAGRDDSVIPQETADYYKKVLNGTGPQGQQTTFDPKQVSAARSYLQAHTDKDASHIDGLQGNFAVKVANLLQNAPPEIRDQLGVFSGRRTYAKQAELWSAALVKYGSPEEARKNVAPPGHSNHETGNAADLSYKGKSLKDAPPEVVNWLHQNAEKYGLKFPLGNENWHIEDSSTRHGKNIAAKSYPDYWNKMSPEARFNTTQIIERKQRERSVVDRSIVDTAVNNAPAAIQNTGQYTGQIPNIDQFNSAYGPIDGPTKQQEFQTAIDTSHQVHDMQTMSGADIQTMVKDATPTSSGDSAGIETAKYSVLSKAAATTIAAREADPVTYVRTAFPNVDKAWTDATQSGDYQGAITATFAAQQQLGIQKQAALPKDVADMAAGKFKDENLPENDRISAIAGLVFATKDPTQRNAIFEQLVAAGVPDATQGAVEAMARGDDGAARRLFQAAIIDPSKLPGVDAAKQSAVDTEVQSKLMDKGQIGNVYYGLSDGTSDNFIRAQRDAKLIKNSVLLRMGQGEDQETAIDNVAKDLYGDVKLVQGDGRLNAEILLPSGEDEKPVIDGLVKRLPEVEKRVMDALNTVKIDLPPNAGNEAVMKAVRENHAKNVAAQGLFKTVPGGYVFIDPYQGKAIVGPDNKPIIFTPAEVSKDEPNPAAALDATPTVDQSQEESDIANYGKLGAQMMKEQRAKDAAEKQMKDNAK